MEIDERLEREAMKEVMFADKDIGDIVDYMEKTMHDFQMALRYIMYPIGKGVEAVVALTHTEHIGSAVRVPKKVLVDVLYDLISARCRIYDIEEAYEDLAICVEVLKKKIREEKLKKEREEEGDEE